MKKRIVPIVLLLALTLSLTALAAEPNATLERPKLSFSGTKAFCSATCVGIKSTDKVEATLTLYQGSAEVDSWSDSGTYRVTVSGECGVKSGTTYRLVLTWTINGVSQPSAETTGTCP